MFRKHYLENIHLEQNYKSMQMFDRMLASFAANGPIICTCLFGIITKRHISGPLHRYHIITPCIQGEEGRMAGGDSDMCLNQMDVLSSAHRFY